MKYRTVWGPMVFRYRSRRITLSPKSEEILRNRLARAEAERRRQFPQYYKD
jgi:hypothetical protein